MNEINIKIKTFFFIILFSPSNIPLLAMEPPLKKHVERQFQPKPLKEQSLVFIAKNVAEKIHDKKLH